MTKTLHATTPAQVAICENIVRIGNEMFGTPDQPGDFARDEGRKMPASWSPLAFDGAILTLSDWDEINRWVEFWLEDAVENIAEDARQGLTTMQGVQQRTLPYRNLQELLTDLI